MCECVQSYMCVMCVNEQLLQCTFVIHNRWHVICVVLIDLGRLRKVDRIFVFGEPEVSVVGIGSNDFSIFRLFELLVEKKWILNSLQFPSRSAIFTLCLPACLCDCLLPIFQSACC